MDSYPDELVTLMRLSKQARPDEVFQTVLDGIFRRLDRLEYIQRTRLQSQSEVMRREPLKKISARN